MPLESLWRKILPALKKFYEDDESVTNLAFLQFKQSIIDSCILSLKATVKTRSQEIANETKNFTASEAAQLSYINEQFTDFATSHCDDVFNRSTNLPQTQLLQFFIKEWINYEKCSYAFNSAAENIDEIWTRKTVRAKFEYGNIQSNTIYMIAIGKWKTNVFMKLKDRLEKVAFDLIEEERNGESVETSSLTTLLDSYVKIGVYQDHFHKEFLAATNNYYNLESAKKIEELSISEYLVHVEERFRDELSRADRYLHSMTREPLLEALDEQFIRTRIESLQTKFKELLVQDNNEDILRRLCSLVSQNPSDLQEFAKLFEEHVKNQGLTVIKGCSSDMNNSKVFVPEILKVLKKYQDLTKNAFGGDQRFQMKFIDGFADFLNNNAITEKYGGTWKVSLIVAKYIDFVLRKNADDDEIEEILKYVLIIITCLQEKDVFQEFYIVLLSERLLKLQSVNDLEVLFITAMKPHFNTDYTRRAEKMMQDVHLSKTITENFFEELGEPMKINFSCMVLQSVIWPNKISSPHNLLSELENCATKFSNFYCTKHAGKKLHWMHHLSSGEVVGSCFKNRFTFTLTTWQMAVLMMFNTSNIWTMVQIQEQTQLEMEVLKQIVSIFLKNNLVTCTTAADLQSDSEICFNENYNNKKHHINLNALLKTDVKKELQQVNKSVDIKRKMLCECSIVRIMKMRKRITYNDLVAEVIPQISKHNFYKVSPADIMSSIEMLIEKSYMEVCKTDKKYYVYVN